MTIKTIPRRASWPAWARWYAVDEDGLRCVFDHMPRLEVPFYGCQSWHASRHVIVGDKWMRDWRSSLRKIV